MDVHTLSAWLFGFNEIDKKYLINGFQNGFSLMSPGINPPPYTQNHKSATTHATALESIISEELKSNRIAGPFLSPPFHPLVLSPLGVVAKKESGKFRVIHDLSYPPNLSVNSSIDPHDASVSYETLDRVIHHIVHIGKGALISKVDIENAFRIIPVQRSDRYLLGFKIQNKIFYDKCLPMGCRTSCTIFERFSSALQWIATNKLNINHITHILDDFIIISPPVPKTAHAQLNCFLDMCSSCNIPIKASKTVLPTTCAVTHGVEVDSIMMQARLPADKLSKARDLLLKYHKRRTITLQELQSLIGYLNFACRVVSPGRAFLRRLCNLTIGVASKHHHITLNKEARADLAAWLNFLSSYNGVSMLLQNSWSSSDHIKLYSDASGSIGFAAVFGGCWFAHSWPHEMQSWHITTMELFPIVLAIEIWGTHLANKRILFKTDNAAVAAIINRQTCKEADTMALVRRMVIASLHFNIFFKAEHIPGYTNLIPDKLSRFLFQEARARAPWLNQSPTPIPSNLLRPA